MKTSEQLKKGDLVQYEKEYMYKGIVLVTSKVVAITDKKILLENGDTFHIIQQYSLKKP